MGVTGGVQAVVFDLFHTLADPVEHAPPGYRRVGRIAEILGVPAQDIALWWEQRRTLFISEAVSPVEDLVQFARSRRIVLDPGHVADLDRALGSAQDAALRTPVAGAVDALQRLRGDGLLLSILSNAVVRDVRTFPLSPLAPLVHDACFSCFTGMVKPNPVAFAGVLDRIGARPDQALFVGDGAGGELEAARAGGYAAVVCVRGPVHRGGWRPEGEQRRIEAGADLVIEDVAQLPDALGR